MKYDDASWHYGGDFPKDSPLRFGATHIALIMKWCFQKGWAGATHTEDEYSNIEVQKVVFGEITGTEFLMRWCDGQLTDSDFTEEGNLFLQSYYGEGTDSYSIDYIENFGDLMYVKGEEDHDFQKFSVMLEKRYAAFSRISKPWWQVW